MARPNLHLTFLLWLPFIVLTSTQDAESSTFFVDDTCIWLNQVGHEAHEHDSIVCSWWTTIQSGVKYSITAGFAQGSIRYPCLKPKWQQTVIFPSIDEGHFFSLKEDYCIYSQSDKNGSKLLTCINTCYKGGPIENPFYHSISEPDDAPKWINPDHGTHQKKYPDRCSHFVVDQSSLKDTDECPLSIGSAFNTPEINNPETATAENADNLEQTFVTQPDLLATNPYFVSDEIIPTPNPGDNNPFLSTQPDTPDINAPTQNWPTGDLMNLLNLEKRARRSPR